MYELTKQTVLNASNEEIECGHLVCDETSTLRLDNVLTEPGDYVFQIELKSISSNTVFVDILGDSHSLDVTSKWTHFIVKFSDVDTTKSKSLDITFEEGEYWFYHTKLETGNIPTEWSSSFGDIEEKIFQVESKINQRMDSIEMSVSSKQDVVVTSIRYIRDWLNGSNISNKNYWLECNIVTKENVNIAGTTTITGKNTSLEQIQIQNIAKYNDENLTSLTMNQDGETIPKFVEDDYAVLNHGKACIEIDLGETRSDIDYIRVWHRYVGNSFVFNHQLQVSIDGVSWITLYDSNINGGYKETEEGQTYFLSDAPIASTINKFQVGLNETKSLLSDMNSDFSEMKQTVDSIEAKVNDNYDEVEKAINSLKQQFQDELDEKTQKAFADFEVKANAIYATVASMNQMNENLASQIRQDSSSWQALFAELNMGENKDKYDIQTNITLNKDGIWVKNPTTGQTTQISIDQFCGWYNNEKIFWVDKDTTKTRRLLCEKGWDTDYIKMTTNAYKYSDGTVLKGVAFVKSGGSS